MEPQPILRPADADERRMFYGWMQKQFHANELKPLAAIEALCAKDCYAVYGFWNRDVLIGYALLGYAQSGRCYLLDYYAVLPEFQDQGWGGRFLEMLREALECDAILLEVEDPEYVREPDEAAQCRRRMRFYERNGCLNTQIRVRLFGVDYIIMQLPLTRDSVVDVRRSMEEIYHTFLPKTVYNMHVNFKD